MDEDAIRRIICSELYKLGHNLYWDYENEAIVSAGRAIMGYANDRLPELYYGDDE